MHAASSIICDAIRERRLLEFHYQGLPRVVQPYCHGISTTGKEVLRAVQVGGSSSSRNIGEGKLWSVAEISALQLSGERFTPDDPKYNPNDSAMKSIHCRIERGAPGKPPRKP